jgi:hypothetical protein
MSIVNFGEEDEDKWLTEYSLIELQEMTRDNYSFEIKNDGRILPLHRDINIEYFEGEYEFKIFQNNQEEYKNIVIRVSNKGRIEINGKIKPQKHDKNKGLIIDILESFPEKVHRLVGLTWRDGKNTLDQYDKKYYIVHHLNGNAYDNDYKNLLWVTCSQHTMIHIKGIWIKNNCQLIIKGNEFIFKNDIGHIINGKFIIMGSQENTRILFMANKKSMLILERPSFYTIILKNNTNFINEINDLIGVWNLNN